MTIHKLKGLELVCSQISTHKNRIKRLIDFLKLFKDPYYQRSRELTFNQILKRMDGVSIHKLRDDISSLRSIGLLRGKRIKDRQYVYYLSLDSFLDGFRKYEKNMIESVRSLFDNGRDMEGV